MRKTLIFTLLAIALNCTAQESLLFELSKPGQEPSYIFGTMHVQNEKAFNFGDSVTWAIDQCENIAFEMDLSIASLQDLDIKSYKNAFGKEDGERWIKFIGSELIPQMRKNVPVPKLMNSINEDLLPAYMNIITKAMAEDNRTMFVDMYLSQYAKSQGKTVTGIETMEEQLGKVFETIKTMPLNKAVAKRLAKGVGRVNWMDNISTMYSGTDDMIESYSNFQLTSLCNSISEAEKSSGAIGKSMYKNVLYDRNNIFFERTKEQFGEGKAFIAVGAGHLCGKSGLLSQYEDAGYSIRPMNLNYKTPSNFNWTTTEEDGYSVEVPEGVQIGSGESDYAYGALSRSLLSQISGMSEGIAQNMIYTKDGMASFTITEQVETVEAIEALRGLYDDVYETDEIYDIPDMEEPMEIEAIQRDVEVNEEPEEVDFQRLPQIEERAEEVIEIEKDVVEVEEQLPPPPPPPAPEQPSKKELKKEKKKKEKAMKEMDKEYSSYRRKSPFGDLKKKDEAYMKELGDSLKGMRGKITPFIMGMAGSFQETKPDTFYIEKDGEELAITKTRVLTTNSLSSTISDGTKTYELTIVGDPKVLQNDEILRFFKSFKLLDKSEASRGILTPPGANEPIEVGSEDD